MTLAQRIKNILIAAGLLLLAVLLALLPQEYYYVISILLGLVLVFYGFRKIWYYATMARHMVGGKTTLYQAVVLLDLGLLTWSMMDMPSLVLIIYLLGFFAVAGVLDILGALERKLRGTGNWKWGLFQGLLCVGYSVALIVFGVVRGSESFLMTGFCISLVVTAIARLVRAFRETSIIFIQ